MYQLLPTVNLGTDAQTRTGNKIKPKGLYVKGHIYGDWNNIVANNSSFQTIYVRIMAIADKQNNVDSLAYAQFGTSKDLLLNKGASSTNFLFNDQTSLYRPINTNRFTVYYDKVVKLSMYSANLGTALIDQSYGMKMFKFKIPMKRNGNLTTLKVVLPMSQCQTWSLDIVPQITETSQPAQQLLL